MKTSPTYQLISRALVVVLFGLCLSASIPAQRAEAARGITPEDYFSFEFISDPQISPDGKLGHTDRFKAAVTLRSLSNFISDDGTRDGAYGHTSDFGGDIFQKYELYWDRSPLKYARNVKTPTLILHSDNDYRVPIEQGEQWFRALKHFGVTTEIVFFPRENHNLTRTGEPKHLVESLNWQLYWFDRFLNGNTSAVPPDAK